MVYSRWGGEYGGSRKEDSEKIEINVEDSAEQVEERWLLNEQVQLRQ